MSYEDIEKYSTLFLKNPIETNAINLLRCIRCNNLFHLGIYIGEYLIEKFPFVVDIKDEYSIMAYYLNKHFEAFDNLQDCLDYKGLTKDSSWKILFNQHFSIDHICNRYIHYDKDIIHSIVNRKKSNLPLISFSITTCKRFDLFEKTINSFLNCVKDIHLIDFWFCVDDNSSDEDRKKMKELYPFFTFYLKNKEEKGHPQSMNIIKNLVKTPYLIHLEDDWKFFTKRNYITDALSVLASDNSLKQCLFNKNYAETESDIDIKGGIFKISNSGVRYFIHEHPHTDELRKKWVEQNGNYKNSSYWPHFSFRPSLLKTDIFEELGDFDVRKSHFEMDYAYRYFSKGYQSAFFEGVYCLHIGRLTSERDDNSKHNAYILNDEKQFSGKEEFLQQKEKGYKSKIKTFIVNLDRRPDRMETFINTCKQVDFLNWERFSAIDGKKLASTRQLQQIFENNDYNMRRGMVGCYLSHVKLFTQLINETDKTIDAYLIFEDDIELQPNFKDKFVHFMKELEKNDDWDLAFLSHHVRDNNNESFFDKKQLPSIEKKSVYESFLLSLGGTTAFIISKNGAKKFLDFVDKTGSTNGIDTLLQKSANELNVYYCQPLLIFSECYRGHNANTLDTDIQNDFSGLEKSIDDRIKDETDFLQSNNIDVFVTTNYDDLMNIIKDKMKHDVVLFKSTEDNINIVEKVCSYPNYKVGNNSIFISKKSDIECYFHRFKKNNYYDISNAIKYIV
jgi:GR25 family glycosyltransferase involved in LPS biosynthesis